MIIQLAETREKRRIEMVNVTMLNDAIKRSGKTKAEVAKSIQMDESTFYRKMSRNGSTFTVEQACRITETLGMDADTAQSIFFAKALA
jgi:DNA-binding phage protein